MAAPVASFPALGASAYAAEPSAPPDPLIARAAAWVAADARLDAMEVEADDLEGQLFDKAKALHIKSIKACRSRLPEARAVRAFKREITAGYRDVEQPAGEISLMRAISVEGTLAKIELALNVQGPFDWWDHALELAAEDGDCGAEKAGGASRIDLNQMGAVRKFAG